MLEREQQTFERDEQMFQRLQQTLEHLQQMPKRLKQTLEREPQMSKREEQTLRRERPRLKRFDERLKRELPRLDGSRLSAQQQVVGLGQRGETPGDRFALRRAGGREAIRMGVAGEGAEGALDLRVRRFEGEPQGTQGARSR